MLKCHYRFHVTFTLFNLLSQVGDSIVFLERNTQISPFLAFLQYEWGGGGGENLNFEPSRQRYFHSRCSSGLRNNSSGHSSSFMSIYSLDISEV